MIKELTRLDNPGKDPSSNALVALENRENQVEAKDLASAYYFYLFIIKTNL